MKTRQDKWTYEKWSGDGEKAGDVDRRTPPEHGEEPNSVEVVTKCAYEVAMLSGKRDHLKQVILAKFRVIWQL